VTQQKADWKSVIRIAAALAVCSNQGVTARLVTSRGIAKGEPNLVMPGEETIQRRTKAERAALKPASSCEESSAHTKASALRFIR
jgi:hypothetical protein